MAKSKIEFVTGSAAIQASSADLLDALAGAVRECPGDIRVEGHTDSRGESAANVDLSIARAQAVRAALISRGIAAEQIQTQRFGAEAPIADNATEAGRGQKRMHAAVGLWHICLARRGAAATSFSWVSEVIFTGLAEHTFVVATTIEDAKDCDRTPCIVNFERDDGAPLLVRDA